MANKNTARWMTLVICLVAMNPVYGLLYEEDFRFRHWGTAEGLPDNTVTSITQTENGFLWLGTSHGLVRFDGHQFTVIDLYKLSRKKTSNDITYLLSERNKLYIGDRNGSVSLFSNGQIEVVNDLHSKDGDEIYAIHREQDNTLHVRRKLSGGFVIHINNKQFSHSKVEIIADFVRKPGPSTPLLDTGNSLWVGTIEDGLVLFFKEQQFYWTEKTGLTSNIIVTLYEDAENNIWIGTQNGGLLKAELIVFANTHTTLSEYSVSTDLQTILANRKKTYPFSVHIKKVSKDDDVPFDLSRKDHAFTFTLPYFNQPEDVQFKYQLSGYDEGWVEAGGARFAHYKKLPPGDYTFNIVAMDKQQQWQTKTVQYMFTVKPGFWQSINCLGFC